MSKDNQQIIIDSLMARVRELENEKQILNESIRLQSWFIKELANTSKIELSEYFDFVADAVYNGNFSEIIDYENSCIPLGKKSMLGFFKDGSDSLVSAEYRDMLDEVFPERKK